MKPLSIPLGSEDLGELSSDDFFDAEVPVELPSGEVYTVLVEVSLPSAWTGDDMGVMIEVTDEDDECAFFLRCMSGLIATAHIGGYLWTIEIGSGPWS